MKLFLFLFLMFFLTGITFSQTSFVVLNPDGQPTGGIDVLRNGKLLGKTGKDGRFIIPKLADGETLVFKQGELSTTYVIQNSKASGMDQKIRLGSPVEEPKSAEEFWGGYDPVPMEPAPKQPSENEVYTIVDEQAEFPGGMTAMMTFIKNNIRYPETAKENGAEGKCYLQFIVEKDGKITGVKVMKGVSGCPECDQEAIRVVKMMPKWKPGKLKGEAVRSYYNLPFVFKFGK